MTRVACETLFSKMSAFDLAAITFKAQIEVLVDQRLQHLVLTHGTGHCCALAGGASRSRRCSRRTGIAATARHLLCLDEELVQDRLVLQPALFAGGPRGRRGGGRAPEGGLGGGGPPLSSGGGRGPGRPREVAAHHALAAGVQCGGDRLFPRTVLLEFHLGFRLLSSGSGRVVLT